MNGLRGFAGLLAAWLPALALAADSVSQQATSSAGNAGASGIWVWANVSDEGSERAYGIELPKKR